MILFSRMVTSRNSTATSKQWLRCAATLGSLTGSCHAFVTTPRIAAAPFLAKPHLVSSVGVMDQIPWPIHHRQKTRLFFSRGNADKDDDWETLKRSAGNLVKKAGEKIMGILPFGKTEEQKQAEIIKKERKAEIQSLFRDLPFPIRMAGRMITPLLNNVAEEIAEQSRAAQDVLEEARLRLVNDASLIQKLGEPLQVGQPFSQSSSTMIINGKSSAKVQASFQVVGPYGSGIATLDSSDGEIRSLVVNVNGFNISVGAREGSAFKSSSSRRQNDVIEAEIIEKK